MIDVTRINNTRFVLNCDLIHRVEETPDSDYLDNRSEVCCERKL